MLFRLSTLLSASLVAVVVSLPVIAKTPVGSALPASAASSAAQGTLTYADLVRTLGKTHGDPKKTLQALAGRSVQLKLIAPGPDSLIVKRGDGVFFECASRSKSFVGGSLTATITAFQLTPDGDSSFTLDRCGAQSQ